MSGGRLRRQRVILLLVLVAALVTAIVLIWRYENRHASPLDRVEHQVVTALPAGLQTIQHSSGEAFRLRLYESSYSIDATRDRVLAALKAHGLSPSFLQDSLHGPQPNDIAVGGIKGTVVGESALVRLISVSDRRTRVEVSVHIED